MTEPSPDPSRRAGVLVEQGVVWLGTLLLIRAVDTAHDLGLPEVVLALVPVLFMYVPVLVCRRRGLDPDAYVLGLPGWRHPAWRAGLREAAWVVVLIAPPFLLLYHLWQSVVFGRGPVGGWPEQAWLLPFFHLFFVAIPEEMFYRGFMQKRLDEVFVPRWNVFGVRMGWGWLITCVLFAFGHSIVAFQWWHFAIFFPSLVFGWLRAKTDDILAGAWFHAWCNVTVGFLDAAYGIPR